MRILIPVNKTEASLHAIDFLSGQSDFIGENPEVTLLTVQTPMPTRIYALEDPDGLKAYYEEEARDVVEAVNKRLPAGHNVNFIHRVGNPAEVIAEVADSLNVDLIVMGTKGHRALGAFLFGSVSNAVLGKVRRPTLMLREMLPNNPKGLKVAVAVDGSDYSERALRYIMAHRALFGLEADFTLVNVTTDFSSIVMPSMAGVPIQTMNQREVSELQDESYHSAVDPLVKLCEAENFPVKTARLVGNPGDAIARYTKEEGFDMVVMGSHGYDNLDAVLLGSVAMRIAAISPLPLLIIR